MKDFMNRLLDKSVVLSFDHSGFMRHCPEPLQKVDLSGRCGIVTGASSGIGLGVSKALLEQGMSCHLVARTLQKLESSFPVNLLSLQRQCYSLDMSNLRKVYSFAVDDIKVPIDLLVHNAGDMPATLKITDEGYEQMFASQILGPFILTKALADLAKMRQGCRIIFVSSGGMYLQKLDLADLQFTKRPYNKYVGYANAKRAQVILAELFAEKYPQYLFSAMHPGWVDTPGVSSSMPLFKKLLRKRLRSVEEGADTILWLATTDDYPSGKFWFDRQQVKSTIFNLNKPNKEIKELLWRHCEMVYKLFA